MERKNPPIISCRVDNPTQEPCLALVLTWGWILLSWASMWANNKTKQARADNQTREPSLALVLTWGWANNKTKEPRVHNKTQEPSLSDSESRMVTEISAGNLALMIRRKLHLPHSDLGNQRLTANCVVTRDMGAGAGMMF
ncbi:uncharacterized protein ACDP82_019008 isoform 2-T2 [Pangshura tecta]